MFSSELYNFIKNDIPYDLIDIVNYKHDAIKAEVLQAAREDLKRYGILLVDVRFKRTNLPEENQKAIFARMTSDRERKAKQYRAEGRKEAVNSSLILTPDVEFFQYLQ